MDWRQLDKRLVILPKVLNLSAHSDDVLPLFLRVESDFRFAIENANRLASRAETTKSKNDKTYQQNQAKPASADRRSTQVKTAATEQNKKHKNKQYRIHTCKIIPPMHSLPWGLSLLRACHELSGKQNCTL